MILYIYRKRKGSRNAGISGELRLPVVGLAIPRCRYMGIAVGLAPPMASLMAVMGACCVAARERAKNSKETNMHHRRGELVEDCSEGRRQGRADRERRRLT